MMREHNPIISLGEVYNVGDDGDDKDHNHN